MTDFSHGVQIQQTQAQFGQKGHYWRVNADGATTSGVVYYAIQAVEASQVDYTDAKSGNTYTNKSIPAGFIIYGELTDITVDSGTVIIYAGDFNGIVD